MDPLELLYSRVSLGLLIGWVWVFVGFRVVCLFFKQGAAFTGNSKACALLDIVFLKPVKKGVRCSTEMLENLNSWYFKVLLVHPEMQGEIRPAPSGWWLLLLLKGEVSFKPFISCSALIVRREFALLCGKFEASIRCGAR